MLFSLSFNGTPFRHTFVVLLGGLLTIACEDAAAPDTQLPDVFVNERVNLSSQEALPLQIDGGFIYARGGLRGLLIYRVSSREYLAFERACPYGRNDTCWQEPVVVDASGTFAEDDCCGSQYGLSVGVPGEPIGGPAAVGLRRYAAVLTGNVLEVIN